MKKFKYLLLIAALLVTVSIVYVYAEDVQEDNPFSGKYEEFEGKDGSVTKIYENGSVATTYKDGSKEALDKDGTRYVEDKNGNQVQYDISGIVNKYNSDGTSSYTDVTGLTFEKDKDVNLKNIKGNDRQMIFEDGKLVKVESQKDGTIEIEQVDKEDISKEINDTPADFSKDSFINNSETGDSISIDEIVGTYTNIGNSYYMDIVYEDEDDEDGEDVWVEMSSSTQLVVTKSDQTGIKIGVNGKEGKLDLSYNENTGTAYGIYKDPE